MLNKIKGIWQKTFDTISGKPDDFAIIELKEKGFEIYDVES